MITTLPSTKEMYRASVQRDAAYEGVFFLAVKTTGIFCRPTCTARKPNAENVEYYPTVRDALSAGYRPCKRCRPLEPDGTVPNWLRPLMSAVEREPARRWTDADLRDMDIEPTRVRRWFQDQHGMTFHSYHRTRRLGLALGRIRHGEDLTATGFKHGFESTSGFRDAFEKMFGSTPGRSRGATSVVINRLLTPLGPMVVAATERGLCMLEFADRKMLQTQCKRLAHHYGEAIVPGEHEHFERLDDELSHYFEGELTHFGVPLDIRGTDFQCAAWKQLLNIPYGETRSYDEQATAIGRPGAQRAIGKANGDNRIAIIIPCHRVIRADGSLSGYGGGLWRKQWLLDHERNEKNPSIIMSGSAHSRS